MSKKFNFSSIVILLSGLLSCAAGVLFQSVNGRFGQMNYDYYNPVIAWGLMGVVVLAVVLMVLKLQVFDPNYLAFCGLMVAAFIIGEVAIYLRKPGQPKKVKKA